MNTHTFQEWQVFGFNSAPARLFDNIESTHSLMKEQAKKGLVPPGSLFIADSQSAGRGRHERFWSSPAGKNLYFNILIPLEGIPAKRYAQITQIAALTFAQIFAKMQEESTNGNSTIETKVTVKWPNDILYGKSKFCGILSEIIFMPASTISNQQNRNVPALSMGVGLNVNSDPDEYSDLNRDITSLKTILGYEVDREMLLKSLIGNLERAIKQFTAFGIAPWVEAWRKMDKFIGAQGTIIDLDNQCKPIRLHGKIIDMQDDGSLSFQCDDGQIKNVYSADLEI